MFKSYWKIYALGKDETIWILNWFWYIQEKIDGANLSIWMEDWEIHVGSRTQEVKDWFRWAVEYVKSHEGIQEYMKANPSERLYWEWLVPHTITNYNPENYNHFYLIDIEDEEWNRYDSNNVAHIWNLYDIKVPKIFYMWELSKIDPTQFVWQSTLWPTGEWVVIKNYNFINQFWNPSHAKIVHEDFKEQNSIVFWNSSKLSPDHTETQIASACVTLARVKKIINKIEQNEDRDIQKSDINKIIWMVYHDIITEELWDIIKKHSVINFKTLSKLCWMRTWRIAVDIIEGNTESVAFN